MDAQIVIRFWFEEIDTALWFKKDEAFDQALEVRFGALNRAAQRGELWGWRTDVLGRLAEIIVLDQFSRNLYRDRPEAFASDPMALTLAQEAVAQGLDLDLPAAKRAFLYMPYMHSESLLIHAEAVRLFSAPDLGHNLEYEHKHKAIIERFGRYPHRNAILGRESTAEELEFLSGPGSSF